MFQKYQTILFVFCFLLLVKIGKTQDSKALPDTTTSDGLFQAARTAAFDNKDYNLAKYYCKKALDISPTYADIILFLGRIYTWTNYPDSAKSMFESVLTYKPAYTDASVAYADLLYWNDQYKEALSICESGLKYEPQSNELLLRKAKALAGLKSYAAASDLTDTLLKRDNTNAAARALSNRIKDESVKNKIGITYDYNVFDKQFADPWHLLAIDYGRTTNIGTIIGRINYANRFNNSATQFEIDAYPHFSKTFYSYMNFGISDSTGVFPHYRGGFSLYMNLPKSYEAELGFRYLKFSGTPTWIYVGYLGKYMGSWLLGARTYITPSDYVKQLSVSYNFSARHYFGGANDYLGFNTGYGISPDDRANVGLLNTALLNSYKVGIDYKKKINYHHIFNASAAWFSQEYLPGTIGHQYQLSIGWQYRF
jgi:YaiO family outer membrane protein